MPVSAGAATNAFALPTPKQSVNNVAETSPSLASVIMFFLSGEFQDSGMFYYLTTKAAFGILPVYGRFEPDIQALGNANNAQRTAFVETFVARPEFLVKYPASQNGSDYIDAVIATVLAGSGVNLNTTSRRPDLARHLRLGRRLFRGAPHGPADDVRRAPEHGYP